MVIEKLSLQNFKNYHHQIFRFSPKVNLIIGPNGSGKTNLLDSIFYLGLTKSVFNQSDGNSIKKNEQFFSIIGHFVQGAKVHKVVCSFEPGEGKKFLLDNKEYNKLSEHIGKFPTVIITPYDTDVIREGSESRRKFFDLLLCQIDQQYLQNLQKYNHFLKQRNALLKSWIAPAEVDQDLLGYYNRSLSEYGRPVSERRREFINDFIPTFKKVYAYISQEREKPSIIYQTSVDQHFEKLLSDNLLKDLELKRTTSGVHKDDFLFMLDQNILKNFGSQGQQKTFVLSLKLSQLEVIKNKKGFAPILLLDDIFDKLDTDRIKKLVTLVTDPLYGQIFITDARVENKAQYFHDLVTDCSIFKIENGQIKNEEELS